MSSPGPSFPGRKSSNCRGPEAGVWPAGLEEHGGPWGEVQLPGGDVQKARSHRCAGARAHSALRDRTGDCCCSNWSRKPLERFPHHLNSVLKRSFWPSYNPNVRGESGSPETRRRQLWEYLGRGTSIRAVVQKGEGRTDTGGEHRCTSGRFKRVKRRGITLIPRLPA